jgi:hypothetical protein
MAGQRDDVPTPTARVRYGDLIEYDTPRSLDDLHGPTTGTVRVRPHINTSPHPVYDLADEGLRWHLYSAVVREGTPEEQTELLDRRVLVDLWPTLNLPRRCRDAWETRFPELSVG